MRKIRAFPTIASRTFTLIKGKRFNREEEKMEDHVRAGHFIGYDRKWGTTFEYEDGTLILKNSCFEFIIGYPAMILPDGWQDSINIDVN